MQKSYFILFFLIFSLFINAQEKFTIKGKVIGANDKFPLESATVYLTTVKDSTMLEYTLTDKNGDFIFAAKKQDRPVFLKVTYMGFETHKEELKEINSNKDFKTISLIESANMLAGVTIKTEEPPIRVKNDTIEFKASLFKVRPDSNVETLLKQLPGFEVDSDGKITVNGKEVNQVLVNGKPFFDRDGAMALKNLPAEIINKVQVSDYKTKNEKFSGERSKSDKSSLNITLKEDKKKGYMLKATAGYGTDNHYEGNLMANYFKGKKKISLIGSSTDIAASGMTSGEGSRGRGGMGRRGSDGITTNTSIGLNYSDQLNDNLKIGADYRLNHSYNKNDNYTRQENLNPSNIFTTTSNTKSNTETYGHNFGTNLEWTKKNTNIYFYPKFSNSSSTSKSAGDSESVDENGNVTKTAVFKHAGFVSAIQ